MLSKIEDLHFFVMRVMGAKFICPKHAKEYRMENAWITSVLSLAFSRLELQFLSTRAYAFDVSLELLIVGYYLEKYLDIIVHCNHIQILAFVYECLESFIVHSLGEVT